MIAPKVSFLDRAIAAFSPRLALERAVARERLVTFGYDAANPGTLRGGSGGMAKNSSSESPQMAQDRVKIMWDARDLERNMPIIRCVLDRVAQYVCGTIQYQAQTGDPQVDTLYEQYWNQWCEEQADITGRHDFRMLIELGFRSMLRDGDHGIHLVRTGEFLQLQMIEADRIGDVRKVGTELSDTFIQGIHLDEVGRPIAYDIYRRERKASSYVKEGTIPAENFCLLTKPLRTDEYRSVSWLAPIIAPARDLYEMFAFERGAAKWAASIAGVIRVTDPFAKVGGGNGAGSAGMWDGIKTDGTPTSSVQPNKLLRLKPNEDVTPFDTSRRPAGAFEAYIDAGLRDIAMGLNVPYGFFDMAKFSGATVRLESQQLQRKFAWFQGLLKSQGLNRIKRAVLNNGIAMAHIPSTPNWNSGRWQFGRHLTADTGYDTDANLALLQNGLKTASEIAGEEGEDFEDLTDQLIKEAVILRDRCAAAGIPIELVATARFPQATQQLAVVAEAQQPEAAPKITEIGDGGVKAITDVLEKAAQGILPREEAIALLVTVYGFAPEVADAVVPEKQAEAVKANQPASPQAPGGKKPAGKGEEKKVEPKKEKPDAE